MQALPHQYVVTATAAPFSDVMLDGAGLPTLITRLPVEFDGPGDAWSPETLLAGAIADCYALTMRGLARRFNLAWQFVECEVTAVLDRAGDGPKFTEVHLNVRLQVPDKTQMDLVTRVLNRAKDTCLITRSLTAETFLTTTVTSATDAAA